MKLWITRKTKGGKTQILHFRAPVVNKPATKKRPEGKLGELWAIGRCGLRNDGWSHPPCKRRRSQFQDGGNKIRRRAIAKKGGGSVGGTVDARTERNRVRVCVTTQTPLERTNPRPLRLRSDCCCSKKNRKWLGRIWLEIPSESVPSSSCHQLRPTAISTLR